MPLTKQNNSIGETFPNLKKEEITIYDARSNSPKFRELKTNEEKGEITDVLGVWCAYVGYSPSPNDLIFINKFLRDSFPSFNIEDLKDLVSKVGTYEIRTEYHGTFSPLYVGKCIAEYLPMRASTIFRINAQLQLHENRTQQLPKGTPIEQFNLFKENMLIAKEKAVDFRYVDNGNIVYDFLIKNNLIDFTKKLIRDATKYANNTILIEHKKKQGRGVYIKKPKISEISTPSTVKKLKRQYAVNKWLRSMKDKEFVDFIMKFKPE